MITLKRHPKNAATILSANPCTVIATTDNGADHYFRVRFIVDFDTVHEESWGRIGTEVRVDVRNFYQNRYPVLARPNGYLNGITRMTVLIVRMQVEFVEYDIATDAIVDHIRTPAFYVMQSTRSRKFDDDLPFQLLDQPVMDLNVHKDSKVSLLAYYNRPVGTLLQMNLYAASGNLLVSKEFDSTGRGMYLMQLFLAGIFLPPLSYLQIGDGQEVFTQIKLNYIEDNLHPPLSLYYKNIHGIFMTADLFGKRETSDAHLREEYARNDNTFTTYDVQSETSFKINTGHLYALQLPLIKAINEAREVFLVLPSGYQKARVTSRKTLGEASGEFLYDDTVEFILENNILADNSDKFDNL